jgi:hypothetical protein
MTPKLNYGMTCVVGIRPLRKLFRNLYSIAFVKDASIAVHLEFFGGSYQ